MALKPCQSAEEAWITHVAVSSDNRNVLTVSILDETTAVQPTVDDRWFARSRQTQRALPTSTWKGTDSQAAA
jgi:hypothetical protein